MLDPKLWTRTCYIQLQVPGSVAGQRDKGKKNRRKKINKNGQINRCLSLNLIRPAKASSGRY